jgi:hypothetical protein
VSRFAIVGAGQSGLQLSIALLKDGHEVTIYSDRTPEQIASGRVPSSMWMGSRALDHERALGICLWEDKGPLSDAFYVNIGDPEGNPLISWTARQFRYGQAVDQRVKFPTWMKIAEELGAEIVIGAVTLDQLDTIHAAHDLTVVAAGKGEIAGLFETDRSRTPYPGPRRHIGMCAVTNVPHQDPTGVSYNIVPYVGEAFGIPALTAAGSSIIWVVEAVPDGPMDRWGSVTSGDDHLKTMLGIFEDFMPWESERHADAVLTDDNAHLIGRVPPTVRKPIGKTPGGNAVVGLADVVVLNDPCTGQGANNAAHHAATMHRLIREQLEVGKPFDQAWMQRTFDEFWEYAQWPTALTNTLIDDDIPLHVVQLLGTAAVVPEIARRFVDAFTYPPDLEGYFFDADKAFDYIAVAEKRQEAHSNATTALAGV